MSPKLISCVVATLALALVPITAHAQSERDVQVLSVDFSTGVLEVFNFGTSDFDLTGWRFCSHDFDQARRYTTPTGLNGVTIEAGTSIFVHFNDDAPGGDPDRLNRSDLGAFAAPLDPDAYGLQFYFPDEFGNINFSNSTLIADHLQWNIAGSDVGMSTTRSSQAVDEGLWTAVDDFIETTASSDRIELIDLSGDEAGGPAEYDVLGGGGAALTITGSCPGDVTIEVFPVTADGAVALVFAPGLGDAVVPVGSCAGTELGLSSANLLTIAPADGMGVFSITRNAPSGACGLFLQAIDATTCETSNAEQLPN